MGGWVGVGLSVWVGRCVSGSVGEWSGVRWKQEQEGREGMWWARGVQVFVSKRVQIGDSLILVL